MSFTINPCRAVMKKVGKETNQHNIHEMNDLCYGICAAYGNPKGCKEQCASLISKKKKTMGHNDCNQRTPYRPPIWNDIPRFMPRLLEETGGDVKKAYTLCCQMADNTRYPNSVRGMCKLDSESVEGYEHVERANSFSRLDVFVFLLLFSGILCCLYVYFKKKGK